MRALFYYLQGGESMITERKGGWENDSAGGFDIGKES